MLHTLYLEHYQFKLPCVIKLEKVEDEVPIIHATSKICGKKKPDLARINRVIKRKILWPYLSGFTYRETILQRSLAFATPKTRLNRVFPV